MIAFIIAYLDKREIGRLLLNRHSFVALPAAAVENDSKDTQTPDSSSPPPIEYNVEMEPEKSDLESNWSELQNMVWI